MLAQSSIVPVCTNLCTAWQLLRMVWKVDMDDRPCSTGNMDEVSLFFFFFLEYGRVFALWTQRGYLSWLFDMKDGPFYLLVGTWSTDINFFFCLRF